MTGWEGLSQEGDAHQAVRPARRHEIQAFCEASFAAFREELGHDPSAHPQDPSYRAGWERALDAGQILGVWDNQGECVYRVELRPVLDRVTELRGVWLHPNLRGLGVARTFLAETTAFVGEHFDSKVVVFARDGNDAAQGLYRSAGFVPRGRLGRLDLANLGPGLL